MFGTQFVGAIQGRLLTAWLTAGILGPVVVNYIRVTRAQVYDRTMYILAGFLVLGFVCNLLVRPVAAHWFMKDAEVAALQARSANAGAATHYGSFGIGKGGFDATAALVWAVVAIRSPGASG